MANLQAVASDGISIIYLWAEGDGSDANPYKSKFLAQQSGLWEVEVSSLPLPPGAASDATITALNSWLSTNLLPAVTNLLTIDDFASQAIEVVTNQAIEVINSVPGLQLYRNTALTHVPQTIKTGAGKLYGWNFYNQSPDPVYIKIYNNVASQVTVGVNTPTRTIFVPPGDGSIHGVNIQDVNPIPQLDLGLGISIAATRDIADSNNTPPTIAVHVEVNYL